MIRSVNTPGKNVTGKYFITAGRGGCFFVITNQKNKEEH